MPRSARRTAARTHGAPTDLDQWKLYLQRIIYPDHKLMPQHQRWIRYTLKFAVDSLLQRVPGPGGAVPGPLLRLLPPSRSNWTTTVTFQLLDTAAALPPAALTRPRQELLLRFAEGVCRPGGRAPSGRRRCCWWTGCTGWTARSRRPRADSAEDRLPGQPRPWTCCAAGLHARAAPPAPCRTQVISDIFLDNLKTGTPWILKQVNIRLLDGLRRTREDGPVLHIATHLSNLVKVSDRVTVRHSAGNALLALAPRLTVDQRNEVSVELSRGLELGQQEFAKYIPDYLGRFALWLPPEQLEELLADLSQTLNAASGRMAASALDTVGVIYEEYDTYRTRFPEEPEAYRSRRERLLGMLMKRLAGGDGGTRQEAMFVLGRRVFGSGDPGRARKAPGLPADRAQAPGNLL